MTLAQFCHDFLARPGGTDPAGIITAAIVGWWRNR